MKTIIICLVGLIILTAGIIIHIFVDESSAISRLAIPFDGIGASVIAAMIFTWLQNSNIKRLHLGIVRVHMGDNRKANFEKIKQKAKHRICLVGVGMTDLGVNHEELKKLQGHALRVPIDIFMISPDYLESNRQVAEMLNTLRNNHTEFIKLVRIAFEELKQVCEEWNSDLKNKYPINLWVYKTIPRMRMVVADREENSGRAVIELFLFYEDPQSKKERIRLEIVKTNHEHNLFDLIQREFRYISSNAEQVTGRSMVAQTVQ